MKIKKNLTHCQKALREIWHLNRVHVSKEMSLAYRLLKKYFVNLKIFGYTTGKKCDGWIVPPSWDVQRGILKDPKGKIIADWAKNNHNFFFEVLLCHLSKILILQYLDVMRHR